MSNKLQHRGEEGHVLEEVRPELKEPSMYKVFLLNDDFTPMEFVVLLLETLFGMSQEKATRVMLQVHTHGKGICGTYTYEVAETKVAQVNEYAQRNEHPLLCSMEKA
jgi:ATP-dependent Clp protease adaptor protein ClpS